MNLLFKHVWINNCYLNTSNYLKRNPSPQSHFLNRRLGVRTGAERRPPPGIQAQHPAPAPHASHARHDRSMARNRLVARAKVGGWCCSTPCHGNPSRVNGESMGAFWFILLRKTNGVFEKMVSQSSSHVIQIRVW